MCARAHMQTLGYRPQVQQLPGGVLHPRKGQVQRPSKLTGGGSLWACREECSGWHSLRRTPPNGRPAHALRILSFFPPPSVGSGQGRHRGGDITGAGAPSVSSAPHSPQPKSALEAEGQQRPARSPPPRQSLGQHGGDRWERAGARRGGAPRDGRGRAGRGNQPGAPPPAPEARGAWKEGRPQPTVASPGDYRAQPGLCAVHKLVRTGPNAHLGVKAADSADSWRGSGHTEGTAALCSGNDS